jgi:hypothetical protein
LDNCDIVPMADPNVPSEMHRNLIAMGIKQFTINNPAYDQVKVDQYVARSAFKMSDADFKSLLAPPQVNGPPPIDPAIAAKLTIDKQLADTKQMQVMLQAQHNEKALQAKTDLETLKVASKHAQDGQPSMDGAQQPDPMQAAALNIKARQVDLQEAKLALDAHNAHADRESKQTVDALKIAQAIAVHPLSDGVVDEQLQQMAPLITPTRSAPMSKGGRVGYGAGGAVPNFGSSPGSAWSSTIDTQASAQVAAPQQPAMPTMMMPNAFASPMPAPQMPMSANQPAMAPQPAQMPAPQQYADGGAVGYDRPMDNQRQIALALMIAEAMKERERSQYMQ